MATAQFAHLGRSTHGLKSDLDMDTFFDFNHSTALNSPATPTAPSRIGLTPGPSSDVFSNNAPSPYDSTEDRQVFSAPSHDYDRFTQQTGFAAGPISRRPTLNTISDSFNPSNAFIGGGFNSGIDDMSDFAFANNSWSTGLDMDTDVNMDFNATQHHNAMLYPPTIQSRSRSQDFVDPSSIGPQEQPQRIWPGMHQEQAQQAAMAKAQAHAQAQAQVQQQQQQQRMHFEAQKHQQQQQQQQQHMHMAQQQQQFDVKHRSRASSYQQDSHTEESISRLLNQMRQNSAVPSMSDDEGGMLPHVTRMRKEEEEMDEDERLLASEEGKKLSSKERRQLRNKVSARAFRSRRKEYISQLEGEVAVKAQECNDLKTNNRSLADENTRYRSLIETLLRHPAYVPFIEEFGKDPAVIGAAAHHRPSMAPTPVTSAAPSHDAKERKSAMPMMETPVDLSMLNIKNPNSNNFTIPSNAGVNFQNPRMYPVHEVPHGPSPLDLALNLHASKQESGLDADSDDFLL